MRFDLIGLAEHNVDAPAISLPPRDTASVFLVWISDSLIIFLAILVYISIGIGIAPEPELLDELFALFIRLENIERLAFFIIDDPTNIFINPAFVDGFDNFIGSFFLSFRLFLVIFLVILSEDRQRRDDQRKD